MFGILIGTLCLIGLVKVARWGRGGRWGGPRRWFMRRMFEELDTTPGQEKVILQAVDSLERQAWNTRAALMRGRGDLARSLRGEHFDSVGLDEAFVAQQASVDAMRQTVRESLQKVHEALDPRQRARLADFIEMGPRHFGGSCQRRDFDRGDRMGGPASVAL